MGMQPTQLLPIWYNHPTGYSLGQAVCPPFPFNFFEHTLIRISSNGAQWVMDQLSFGAAAGRKEAAYQAEKAGDAVKEGATYASNRAGEAAQKAGDKIKEEL